MSFLFDAHTHLHACFEESDFLAAVCSNFRQTRRGLGLATGTPGVLAVHDVGGHGSFERLRRWESKGTASWRLEATAEEASMVLVDRSGSERIILIAGSQIATAQGFEVLAVGTSERFEDGGSVARTLSAVRSCGALAIAPWGFGKWWFRRGGVLARLLAESDPSWFFLGDNGGRPRWGPSPRAFRLAEAHGIRILPGSDPLPFPAHVGRAGSYGAVVEGGLDPRRPAASVVRLLSDGGTRPEPYGGRRPLGSFLRDQAAMQLRKRRASRPR